MSASLSSPREDKLVNALFAAVIATVAGLLFLRLSSFGIWDPHELVPADEARRLIEAGRAQGAAATGTAPAAATHPFGALAVVAFGFKVFRISEWGGRFPIALCALLTVASAFGLVRAFTKGRAPLYASIVAASTPLFVMNGREMLGAAPGFLAQSLCALGVVLAILPAKESWVHVGGGLLLAAAGAALATTTSGALLGPIAPIVAGAMTSVVLGRWRGAKRMEPSAIAGILLWVGGIALLVRIAAAIRADAPEFSIWVGGAPAGGTPPGFETVIEEVFHSFAPWSAFVPVAVGRMFAVSSTERATTPDPARRMDGLRIFLLAWVFWGYGAHTLFASRYGAAPFLPVVGLAAMVGIAVVDLEESKARWPVAALLVFFLSCLLIRDYSLFPGSPVAAVGLADSTVPAAFNPRFAWMAVFGLFAAVGALVLFIPTDPSPLDLRAPYRLLREQWDRGLGFRVILTLAGVLIVTTIISGPLVYLVKAAPNDPSGASVALRSAHGVAILLGALLPFAAGIIFLTHRGLSESVSPKTQKMLRLGSYVLAAIVVGAPLAAALRATGPSGTGAVLQLSSFEHKIVPLNTLVLLVIPIIVALGQLLFWAVSRLGAWRMVPLLAAGLCVGAYTAQGYIPQLSAHLSPREVYDTYNSLRTGNEPLAEYQVGGRAAAYYANGETTELQTVPAFVDYLMQPGRRWVAFPTDRLPELDRAYRQRSRRHLFVADARSARVLLAANEPVPNRQNENFLSRAIFSEPPAQMQHRLDASFEDKIELLGYDIELPQGDYVGPGQTLTIHWYWRVLRTPPAGLKIFLHVDGQGNRLNGDHEPVDEKYPIRLWDPGDVIRDSQRLSIPLNYRVGTYTLFIGFFYHEDQRLRVVRGPNDGVNRVNAGIINVR